MLNQFKNSFICAHPDDEVIGCGGTISLLSKNKSEINLLVLTNGESSRNLKSKNLKKKKKKIKERKIACINHVKILELKIFLKKI